MDSHEPPPLPPFRVSDIGAPTWPRRAAKACASCRRDKIRCDGARPCSGCIKRGYAADQCIDGCEHCRRARMRCEGGKPCARCREMQLECVDEASTPPFRQDSSSAKSAARSARAKANDRAKLACQNCRRDNKKCDDTRPCQRCVARSEECIHVGRGPKLVKLRCEACRKDNKKCEDMRPCRSCVEQGKECINLIRKGRGHGTRVKAACTNCRRDKIRCDGVRPCAACARKGYECLDRACKSCTQKGQEMECTHRRAEDIASDADDEVVGGGHVHASSSGQHIPGPPPPMAYPPLNYAMPQYYPPPPHGALGPHQLPPMLPSPMYPPDPRAAYYPVIDPNIDNTPPTRIVSSERTGAPSTSENPGSH